MWGPFIYERDYISDKVAQLKDRILLVNGKYYCDNSVKITKVLLMYMLADYEFCSLVKTQYSRPVDTWNYLITLRHSLEIEDSFGNKNKYSRDRYCLLPIDGGASIYN